MKPAYVKVAAVSHPLESNWIADVLEQNGIPFYLEEYRDLAYPGLQAGQRGWGAVYVPPEAAAAAEQLIRQTREALANVPDGTNHPA